MSVSLFRRERARREGARWKHQPRTTGGPPLSGTSRPSSTQPRICWTSAASRACRRSPSKPASPGSPSTHTSPPPRRCWRRWCGGPSAAPRRRWTRPGQTAGRRPKRWTGCSRRAGRNSTATAPWPRPRPASSARTR